MAEIFSPYAVQAEIATYYQKIIYQIHDQAARALPKGSNSSNNKKKSNRRD
ncbi:hypothetical protein [Okeania sp. SIO2B3]|uniref:hypothetical protein n=1 Tax=Okeania sp. SIO2B3 TaxID=2607784 RepID=UPI0013C0651B|nr:hypothetical protein [Okeania sp. SIO2B3]NET42588.1 hypothetical protein [Okeania sp. SIO2B3]